MRKQKSFELVFQKDALHYHCFHAKYEFMTTETWSIWCNNGNRSTWCQQLQLLPQTIDLYKLNIPSVTAIRTSNICFENVVRSDQALVIHKHEISQWHKDHGCKNFMQVNCWTHHKLLHTFLDYRHHQLPANTISSHPTFRVITKFSSIVHWT